MNAHSTILWREVRNIWHYERSYHSSERSKWLWEVCRVSASEVTSARSCGLQRALASRPKRLLRRWFASLTMRLSEGVC